MPYDINSQQIDIENLFKQNANDLSSIKELYRRLKDLDEKITQIKYIDSKLADKLKKDYESLKRIILDENIQVELTNDINKINTSINKINNDINEVSSQLDNIITYPILEKEYGSIVGWEYAYINHDHATETCYVKNIQYPYGDVRRYGAIGDGITDDTVAIQRAFECSTKVIFEKNKTYVLNSGIWIGKEVEVEGNNAKLIFTLDSTNQLFYKGNYETSNKGLFSDCLFKTNYFDYTDATIYFDHFIIDNLKIEVNLNFVYNSIDYRVFELCGYGNIIFKNTSIIVGENYVYDVENDILNTTYVKNNIQPILIRNCSNNVLIDNVSILNFTKGNWGSTLWFHAQAGEGHNNIKIMNSVFYTQAGDEILSFMGNRDIIANIYNCKIERKNNGVFNPKGDAYRTTGFMIVASPLNYNTATGKIELNFNGCEIKTINSDPTYNTDNLFGCLGGPNFEIHINLENCITDLYLKKTLINSESSVTTPFCSNNIEYMMKNYIRFNNSRIQFKGDSFLTGIGGTDCINHTITNSTIITNRQLYNLEYCANNCITSNSCELKNNTVFIERVDSEANIFLCVAPEYFNRFNIVNNVFYTVDSNNNPVSYNLLKEKSNTTTANFTMLHKTNAEYVFINNNNYINNILVE